jgi:hypothetical protein
VKGSLIGVGKLNVSKGYLENNHIFTNAIFFLLILVVYIDFPISVGGKLFPSVGAVIIGLPFMLIAGKAHLVSVNKSGFILWLKICFFILLSMIFFGEFDVVLERFNSFSQIIFALTLSYFSYIFLIGQRDYFLKVSKAFSFLLVLLAFLENIGLIKEYSDAFRGFVFSDNLVTYLYTSSDRDMNLYGFDRPKVFSAEPSFVSIMFFVSSICYLKLDRRFNVFVSVLGLSVAMMKLNPSPINFAQLFVVLYVYAIETKIARSGVLGVVALACILLLGYVVGQLVVEFTGRTIYTSSLLYATEADFNSQTIRLVIPIYTASEVLNHYPLFGVGLGGKSTLELISTLRLPAQLIMGTNNLFTPIMYFGGVGALIYYYLLVGFIRSCDKLFLFSSLPVCLIYSSMLGGFESVRYWFFFFMLLAACHLSCRLYKKDEGAV